MEPYTGKIVEIEPWTSYIEEYMMQLCWKPESYDYTYNHYDETERFLTPVKKLLKDFEIEKPAQKPDGKGSTNISNTPSRANIVKDQDKDLIRLLSLFGGKINIPTKYYCRETKRVVDLPDFQASFFLKEDLDVVVFLWQIIQILKK